MANSKYALQYDEDNLQNKNKQINTINEIAAKNKQTITETHNAELKETEKSYDDQHRINAVQKLINERQVAENMANLGLTDSGLNRTQQTAVQLSYANQNAKLNTQRQSAIDALNRQMAAYITDIDTKAASDIADIENTYAQNRQSFVSAMEQKDIEAAAAVKAARIKAQKEAENARIKAQQEAEAKISRIGYGTLASMSYGENGNVIYTDTNGNSVKMRAGANPYTGNPHKDVLDFEGKFDASKTFSNGYQPNNINGEKLRSVSGAEYIPTWRTDGKPQKVFSTDGGKTCYVWNGPANRYERVYETDTGEWMYIQNMIDSGCSTFNESEWREYFSSLRKRKGESYAKSMYYALKSSDLIPTKMQNIAYLATQGKITGH